MGDYIRWSPPYYEGAADTAKSALFLSLNRGKRSIRLNLKSDGGTRRAAAPGPRRRRAAGVLPARRARSPRGRLRAPAPGEPGLVYCAITGYGQDGPNRGRSGHDMNYLGLNGLLGLTGEAGGPPVQAAGQIADLGGGALMAAVGILDRAARARAIRRGPAGRLLDVRRLAVVAGDAGRRGLRHRACAAPRRSRPGRPLQLLPPLRVRRRLRHPRRAGAEVLAGVLRGRRAARISPTTPSTRRTPSPTPRSSAIFRERTRDQWRAFASEHDCCLEPVLGLDEALESELVAAREMVVELAQPGAERPVKLLGVPVKLSRTPGDATRAPGPELGEHTDEVLTAAGYSPDAAGRAARVRRHRRRRRDRARLVHLLVGWPSGGDHRRHAEDVRAGRALRGERRHDQALPARGAARDRSPTCCARAATWPITPRSSSSGSG